jgi:putative hemolysin
MSNDVGRERFADVRNHLPFLSRHERSACLLESFLCYPEIRRTFAECAHEVNPCAAIAKRFGLTIRMEGLAERIPREGPVVVLANHGHGGADAVALMAAMSDLRKDFHILANREVTLLDGIEAGKNIIPVDLLEGKDRGANPAALRTTLKHVRDGGALGIFPAGRVAYWQGDRIKDPEWSPHIIRLLQRMNATVIPLWFFGSQVPWISVLSRLSAFVRTALIPTSLVKMKGREIVARAGDPLDSRKLRDLGDEAGAWMRGRLEAISELGN